MVTVYSSPGCARCKATVREFEKGGVTPRVEDVRADPQAAEHAEQIAQAIGSRELPLVVAGGRIWSGFRPDQIRAVTSEQREPASPSVEVDASRRMSA